MKRLGSRTQSNLSGKYISLLLVIIIFCASVVSLVGPTVSVNAITTSSSKSSDADWQIKSLLYYRSLTACLVSSGMNGGDSWTHGGRIDNEKITSGEWFSKSSNQLLDIAVPIGVYLHDMKDVGDDGVIGCNQPGLVKDALSLWGLDAATVLCNIGMQRVDMGSNQSKSDCINGKTQLERPAWSGIDGWPAGAMAFQEYIRDTIYKGAEPSLLDSEWYTFYKTTLSESCISGIGLGPSSDTKAADNQLGYNNVKFVDLTRSDQANTYQDLIVTGSYSGDKKRSDIITTRAGVLNGITVASVTMSCEEATANMSKYADAYAKWAFGNIDEAKDGEAGQQIDPDGSGDTTSCAIDGIGWIICPVITFSAGLADSMYSILSDNFLKVGVSVVNSNPDNGPTTTYNAWQTMQGLANVILVIVFLAIIFSQITGWGISNLGIKKMLPKLVIAALLMNISFIICQIAVDVSNILGYSLKDFFTAIAEQASSGSDANIALTSDANFLGGTNYWGNIAGGVLAGVATIAAGFFLLSMLGTVLLAALFALLMILLILVARQAIIVLAIIVAPIAIALWLLPNTKKLAEQWWKIFSQMLMLFPIIALIFGASTLASVVLRDSFSSFTPDNDGVNWLGQIIAAGIQVIPLFLTPIVLKGALNVVPAIGSMVNKMSSRANGNLSKKMGESYRGSVFGRGQINRRQGRENYRTQKFAERLSNAGKGGRKGLVGNMYKVVASGQPVTGAGRYANKSLARSALAVADKADTEEVAAAETMMRSGVDPTKLLDHARREMITASRSGDSVRARAAQKILLSGGGKGLDKLYEAYIETESGIDPKSGMRTGQGVVKTTETMKDLRSALNAAGVKPKNNVLATWAYNDSDTSLTGTAAENATLASLNDVELAGQRDVVLQAGKHFITQAQAKSIVANDNVFKDVSPVAKAIFMEIANGGQSNSGSTTPPNPSNPTPPTSRETIATASDGSGGSIPFSMDTGGARPTSPFSDINNPPSGNGSLPDNPISPSAIPELPTDNPPNPPEES